MPLLDFLGLVIGGAVLLFLVTQIVLPAQTGTPFFPFFKKRTALKQAVNEASTTLAEKTELVSLRKKLAELEEQINKTI